MLQVRIIIGLDREEAQYDEMCCIVDDIAATIDAALSKQRITGARELLRSIRDALVEMTGR